jgi:hypothetical protein
MAFFSGYVGEQAHSASLVAHYQDGAVGVPYHGIRDAPHQSPPYPTLSPTTHHYQSRAFVLRMGDDLIGGAAYRQVSFRDAAPTGLDLFYLPIANPPAFFFEIFVPSGVLDEFSRGDVPGFHFQDIDNVEFGTGAFCQIGGGGGGQVGFVGAVRCQKDLGREYAHLVLS